MNHVLLFHNDQNQKEEFSSFTLAFFLLYVPHLAYVPSVVQDHHLQALFNDSKARSNSRFPSSIPSARIVTMT
jgi:hypothetical protein